VSSSDLKGILEEIITALGHEREAILTRPSKLSSRCFDGRLLSGQAGAFAYRFVLENEVELHAGLPCLLLVGGTCTRGNVQTTKGSEVQILVEEHMGDEVKEGDLLVLENVLVDQLVKLIEQIRDGKREGFNPEAVKRVFGLVAPEIAEAGDVELPPAEADVLNAEQMRAIKLGSASNLLLLCGPSGTGKTRTIAALAANLAAMGERILIVSHTPHGCDRALDQFYATLSQTVEPPEGSVLRLGPAEELSESTAAAVVLHPVAENSLSDIMRPSWLLGLRSAHRERLERIRQDLEPIELRSTTSKLLQGAESAVAEIRAEVEELSEVMAAIEAEVAENQGKRAPAVQFLGEWQASPTIERCRKQILQALKTEGAKLPFPENLTPAGSDDAQPVDDVTQLLQHAKELAHAYPACKPAVETIELLKKQMDTVQRALPVARVLHRTAENNLLADSLVIGTTVTRGILSPAVFDGQFDSVIIDEAHRVSIPALLVMAGLAKSRVILSGDFRMPPGAARSSEVLAVCRKTWAQDVFDWSGVRAKADTKKDVPGLVFLDAHYRAYPDLTPWQGEVFYGRKIRDGMKSRPASEAKYALSWAKGPVALVDTSGLEPWTAKAGGRSTRFNLFHAAGVVHLVNELLDGGCDPEEIAVVVPGEAQLKAVQKLLWHDNLTSILVATLQQFQNTERDVVIFDLPDGPPHEVARNLSGQEADLARRLLNVPMSRARRQVILLGNLPYLKAKATHDSPLSRLLAKMATDAPAVALADITKNSPDVLKMWCDLAPSGYAAARFDKDVQAGSGDLYFWLREIDLTMLKRLGDVLSRGKEARTAYLFTAGKHLRDSAGLPMAPADFSRALFGHPALPHVRFVLTPYDLGPMALIGNSVVWATTQSPFDERVRRMGYARVEAPEIAGEIHRMFQVPAMLARLAKLHERMALPLCQTCKEPVRLGSVAGQMQPYCSCTTSEIWKTQELAVALSSVAGACPRCGADLVADQEYGATAMRCGAGAGCGFAVGRSKVAAPVKPQRKPPVRKPHAPASSSAEEKKE